MNGNCDRDERGPLGGLCPAGHADAALHWLDRFSTEPIDEQVAISGLDPRARQASRCCHLPGCHPVRWHASAGETIGYRVGPARVCQSDPLVTRHARGADD